MTRNDPVATGLAGLSSGIWLIAMSPLIGGFLTTMFVRTCVDITSELIKRNLKEKECL